MSAFSVSTSATMSPRLTRSPGLIFQAMSLPASMSAPRLGMRNSVIFLMAARYRACIRIRSCCFSCHGANRARDRFRLRQGSLLQMLRVWHRDFSAANALNGSVQVVEGLFHDSRADLSGDAAAAPALIDNKRAVCPPDGVHKRFGIERPERPEIDHFALDSFRREGVRGLKGFEDVCAVGDDRHIAAAANNLGSIDIHCVGALR